MKMDNKTFDGIRIGDSARLQRTLTKEEIEVFGALSGDMNPTHFSDEYARMPLDRHKDAGHSIRKAAHQKVTYV
jgi:acyl dehydratase